MCTNNLLCTCLPNYMIVYTNMAAVTKQVALLWQRDRATRLSVEILQIQTIVWHYLRDPTFSRFYTIPPKCDRHTHRQMDGQIHDDGMYCA